MLIRGEFGKSASFKVAFAIKKLIIFQFAPYLSVSDLEVAI